MPAKALAVGGPRCCRPSRGGDRTGAVPSAPISDDSSGALAVVIMIGVYAVLFGGALVGLGLRLRRMRRRPGVAPGAHRPATAKSVVTG